MTQAAESRASVFVRDLIAADLDDVVRIDALHTGERKKRYWRGVLRGFLGTDQARTRVGLAACSEDGSEQNERVIGYLLGEVRAFEFGSEPCGWVFAVAVDPASGRERVASRLLAECCARFSAAGVERIRTMVQRNNIPVLSFFRANGFVAGRFVQLELGLEEKT